MKKILTFILFIGLSSIIFLLGFSKKNNLVPNYLYKVYLDDQVLGVIKNKNDLEKYIDDEGSEIKEKYNVKKVYAPEGLQIRKIITYNDKIDNVKDVYKKLKKLKPFTIEGYKFTIKNDDDNSQFFVTSEDIFKKAIKNTIITFVGEENYNKFINKTQSQIDTTGTYYDDIYVDNVITSKKIHISINEKIYSNFEDLSKYILFKTEDKADIYKVKKGDTIATVAFNNKISIQEFLISNPEFSSEDNILYEGQEVNIAYADPIINVITKTTSIEDQTKGYNVEERNDSSMISGYEKVLQEGSDGVDRVNQENVYVNGYLTNSNVIERTTIKPATNKIVLVGSKVVSGVGGRYWTWPTISRKISSGYGYRSGSFHRAIDITGNYNDPIYAANNGVITKLAYSGQFGTYGNCIVISHNNGYSTLYSHMAGFAPGLRVGSTVERGQVIAYMGRTGRATGVHLHFELMMGNGYTDAKLNPLMIY